jgi:hypothetical protein
MSAISFLGRATRSWRAGEEKLILRRPEFAALPGTIEVTSTAFADGGPIPACYTVSGENLSPPLAWRNLPAGTRELALMVEDYDVPLPLPITHLLVYGLLPAGRGLAEDALPSANSPGFDAVPLLGKNARGKLRYDGPGALPGHGPHHYVFEVFALDCWLSFDRAPNKADMIAAMKGHVLATGRLTGTFERE